eukprot:TRINITY_DN13904_c0_g1_i2.p1 TRINITY_DN13904_c0_g1~~TRINITY_DN13904_c0_g1_i2.p1  ORF type:complete len:202 (+),score=44.65 TRINITY_DN13904_c0_g1_i2:160-765(+)
MCIRDSSTGDFTASGRMGITHELAKGSIVYAVDINVTYSSTRQVVRKWFAGWNDMLLHTTRRYFVLDTQGSATCRVEQDRQYVGSDPFQSVLDRFVSSVSGVWEYAFEFEGNSHQAETRSDPAGNTILGTALRTFEGGVPGSVIVANYSSIGTSPEESLFWPRNQYSICYDAEKKRVTNFSSTGVSSVCVSDLLALEYGCL